MLLVVLVDPLEMETACLVTRDLLYIKIRVFNACLLVRRAGLDGGVYRASLDIL